MKDTIDAISRASEKQMIIERPGENKPEPDQGGKASRGKPAHPQNKIKEYGL